MHLYIDTTELNKVKFALSSLSLKQVQKQVFKIKPHESFKTVAKLEEFLKKNNITKTSIKKVIVNKGPGSFVGTRVGVTIAQALGLAWHVPIKFLSKDEFDKYLLK